MRERITGPEILRLIDLIDRENASDPVAFRAGNIERVERLMSTIHEAAKLSKDEFADELNNFLNSLSNYELFRLGLACEWVQTTIKIAKQSVDLVVAVAIFDAVRSDPSIMETVRKNAANKGGDKVSGEAHMLHLLFGGGNQKPRLN